MVMVTAFGLSAVGFGNTALAATVSKMHDIGPAKTTFVAGNGLHAATKTKKKHVVKKVKTALKHVKKVAVHSPKAAAHPAVTSVIQ